MTPAQEGAYIRLLAYAWADPDCSIPDNDDELAVLSRLGEEWLKGGSTKVRNCFEPHPEIPGRLVNRRLLDERIKQQIWREKSSLGGQKSGEARRSKSKQSSSAPAKGGLRVVQPNANQTPTLLSSSSSSIILEDESSGPLPEKKKTRRKDDPLVAIFLQHFQRIAETPYLDKQGDYVQLAKLRSKCVGSEWELTPERFTLAVEHYFASDLGQHTLADLCTRFSTFYKSSLDRFGKPIEKVSTASEPPRQITQAPSDYVDLYKRGNGNG